MKIYLEKTAVIDEVSKAGREVKPEVGWVLVGLNPRYTNNFDELYVLAAVQRTIGSEGGVVPGHVASTVATRMLYDAGLLPQFELVGWAHTHPWQDGHHRPSNTDLITQLKFQIGYALAMPVAVLGSKNGLAVYRARVSSNEKAGLELYSAPYNACERLKEFPKLEALLKNPEFMLKKV